MNRLAPGAQPLEAKGAIFIEGGIDQGRYAFIRTGGEIWSSVVEADCDRCVGTSALDVGRALVFSTNRELLVDASARIQSEAPVFETTRPVPYWRDPVRCFAFETTREKARDVEGVRPRWFSRPDWVESVLEKLGDAKTQPVR